MMPEYDLTHIDGRVLHELSSQSSRPDAPPLLTSTNRKILYAAVVMASIAAFTFTSYFREGFKNIMDNYQQKTEQQIQTLKSQIAAWPNQYPTSPFYNQQR